MRLRSSVSAGAGLLVALLAVGSAHAFGIWESASRMEPEADQIGCMIAAKERQVVQYSTTKWDDPRSPPKAQPDAEPRKSRSGEPLQFWLNKDECAAFHATRADGLFNMSNYRSWFRKSDFLTFSELPKIERWTTRYIFRRTALSGANSELGTQPDMISLDQEIDAYRASTIRDSLFVFTPDGHWLDFKHNVRWEMRITSDDSIIIGDPSGRYAERYAVFHRSYRPRCSKGADNKLTCGLYWAVATDRCAEKKDLSKEPPHIQKECAPEELARLEMAVGTLAELDKVPYPTGKRVSPEKVVITGRFTYGQRDYNQQMLSFIAHFSDPIRPIVFAPGVLFSDTAKPHRGKPRPGELVMKEVCLADCPDQLAAQGLLAPPSAASAASSPH